MFRAAFVGAIVIAAGIVAACQEPDPNYGDPSGILGKKLPGETPLTGGSTSGSTDGGGSTSGSSGGGVTAPVPTVTVALEHADSGGVGPAVPFSTDCLTCHNGTTATKFAYGGLLSNANGANVVVAVDSLNPTSTDDAGYFWGTDTTAIAANAAVSFYENGTVDTKMPGLPAGAAGGACLSTGSCHGGSQGPITLVH